jgi:Ser/Thr protein kinase RdoA (MazF antagonist)
MAGLARMVRANTAVPTYDVIGVDVTRRLWPWQYLIVTRLPGVTWAELYPRLDGPARAIAQRQIGRCAAELHSSLRFDAFGQVGPDGVVLDGTTVVAALQRRALQRLTTPRYRAIITELLESRTGLFTNVSAPTLCHEDLNPYNVLFELHEGRPTLSGILDFESAWAGTGESDLARLELWWLTTGRPVREGYREVAPIAAGYLARRPILQLLWCLEYAEYNQSPQHQAVTAAVCAELGMAPISLHAQ